MRQLSGLSVVAIKTMAARVSTCRSRPVLFHRSSRPTSAPPPFVVPTHRDPCARNPSGSRRPDAVLIGVSTGDRLRARSRRPASIYGQLSRPSIARLEPAVSLRYLAARHRFQETRTAPPAAVPGTEQNTRDVYGLCDMSHSISYSIRAGILVCTMSRGIRTAYVNFSA